MNEDNRVLNAVQAAELLGAHVESVRRLARKGEIPCYKIGKDWRFRSDALREWMGTHHERQRLPLILVVDDEKSFRTTTRIFLESENYRVVLAEDGRTALDMVRREPPDLVLLDLVLPGLSGVDVLRELHSMDLDLPVIVVTAYPDSEMMAEALRYPPVMLLPKPQEKETLIRTVRRVMDGAKARRPQV